MLILECLLAMMLYLSGIGSCVGSMEVVEDLICSIRLIRIGPSIKISCRLREAWSKD